MAFFELLLAVVVGCKLLAVVAVVDVDVEAAGDVVGDAFLCYLPLMSVCSTMTMILLVEVDVEALEPL